MSNSAHDDTHPLVLKMRLDALEERVNKHKEEGEIMDRAHDEEIMKLLLFKERINTLLLVGPLLGSVVGGVVVAIIVKFIFKG